jgi:serine/threonine-protein kinase HipA
MTERSGLRNGKKEMQALSVRLSGEPVARLSLLRDGSLQLQYLPEWTAKRGGGAYPLSLNMPVSKRVYNDDVVAPFVSGLLPDNITHRKNLADIFHVSYDNDFSLVAQIGRECAGAVSILPLDADVIREDDIPEVLHEVTMPDLATLLRELPQRPLFADETEMRLSLAGVNDKAAVLIKEGRMYLPQQGYPSSHILKTDIQRLDDSAKVESFCLQTAKRLGMTVPRTKIAMAEDMHFMLIARYDRVLVAKDGGHRLRRIHQVDFCQALGIPPNHKYESEGGPSWKQIFALIEKTDAPIESSIEMLRRCVYNYLVNNPDAHGKNFALTVRPSGLKLAPLYDVNNAAAFRDKFKKVKPRMAMSIAKEFDPTALTGTHWDAFADECGLSPDDVRNTMLEMAAAMPEVARSVAAELEGTPGASPRIALAIADIEARCAAVPDMLAETADLSASRGERPDMTERMFSGAPSM